MRKTFIQLIFLALVATATPFVHAQARPTSGNIELKNVAEIELEVKAADGKIEKKRVPVQVAVPGTVVFYTSIFKNIGARPASNINITNPVPANTSLVAASAFGDGMDITYSTDGGKTWATASQAKVKGADGQERAAGVSDFTHIKWALRGELPAGKQSEAGFRVVVK